MAELVAAVVHEPSALPSLQFTLAELADRSVDGTLTLDAYREVGGVAGSIAARADDLYVTLPSDERLGVRRMFEQLVVVGPEGEPTRRRALLTDVGAILPDHDGEGLDDIVDVWARARFLTLDRHPDSREPTVEVAHEALLREWPRLRDWLDEDREDIAVLAHLREAASGWEALGRDPGALYRGARLETASHVADARGRALPAGERAFLDASQVARDAERRHEADQLRRTASANRRLRGLLLAVGVALAGAIVAGAVAVGQRNRAASEGQVATARELAAAANATRDVDPERSVHLALAAIRQTGSDDVLPEAEQALHDAVTASRVEWRLPGSGGAVAWSPDGARVASAGPDGDVFISDALTGKPLQSFTAHDARVSGLAFNPDGNLLGTTGEDGVAKLWDWEAGRELHAYESPTGGGRDALVPSFSPDGSLFAASWRNEALVRVIDVSSGDVVSEITGVPLPISTSFDPSGTRLAVAQTFGDVHVVDARTGTEVLTLLVPGWATDAAWSPDGASIAVAGEDGNARVFDAVTGVRLLALLGHTDALTDISWSADSSRLVTASKDGTARAWRRTESGGREAFTLSVQDTRSGVAGAVFSPDGTRIVTGDVENRATIVWNASIGGDAEVATLPGSSSSDSTAFTPDGQYLLTGNAAGGVAVWDAETFAYVRTLGSPAPSDSDVAAGREVAEAPDGGTGLVTAIDVSPDGNLVAVSIRSDCCPGEVRVWDVTTGREAFDPLSDPTSYVDDIAWSPDGDRLAIARTESYLEGEDARGSITVLDDSGRELSHFVDEDPVMFLEIAFTPDGERLLGTRSPIAAFDTYFGEVRVWDWAAGTVERTIETPNGYRTAFSPSAGLLASTPPDFLTGGQAVDLWDWKTGRHQRTLAGHSGAVTRAVFSADGSRLATAGRDGTIRLWDPETGEEQLILHGHRGEVSSVAFSPDGHRLASVGADGTVRVWALDLDELVDIAEDSLTRSFTDDECRRYLHVDSCRG